MGGWRGSDVGRDVSSSLAGFILFGLFHGGVLLNFDTSGEPIQFTISAALLFGTICAAVDPVAVSAANHVLRQLLLLRTSPSISSLHHFPSPLL